MHQFVKLKDIKGHAHYSDENQNTAINGNDKEEEDKDVSMLITGDNNNEDDMIEYLWQLNAIKLIDFGLLNKVFLKFENVFWDIQNDYVGYAS